MPRMTLLVRTLSVLLVTASTAFVVFGSVALGDAIGGSNSSDATTVAYGYADQNMDDSESGQVLTCPATGCTASSCHATSGGGHGGGWGQ